MMRGFTLIELLTALVILSIVGLMSYRGLNAVVETRERVAAETSKWRGLATFFERFEHDLALAAPRAVRRAPAVRPAFIGHVDAGVEFSRFPAAEGVDMPRRVGYAWNGTGEVELVLWPGLDASDDVQPARYIALAGVRTLELSYMSANGAWLPAWPASAADPPLPRAVRVRVVLVSGEDIVRIFAVQS